MLHKQATLSPLGHHQRSFIHDGSFTRFGTRTKIQIVVEHRMSNIDQDGSNLSYLQYVKQKDIKLPLLFFNYGNDNENEPQVVCGIIFYRVIFYHISIIIYIIKKQKRNFVVFYINSMNEQSQKYNNLEVKRLSKSFQRTSNKIKKALLIVNML